MLAHAMFPVYIVYTCIYNSIMFASFFICSKPLKKFVWYLRAQSKNYTFKIKSSDVILQNVALLISS